jgi:glutathione S-transferase
LVEDNGMVIPDSAVICEYLDEAYPEIPIMGDTIQERVEVRRLAAWFDGKFAAEVTQNLLGEKYMRAQARRGNADPASIRTGYTALRYHLDYLGWLAENREWLAGPNLSLADFAAAAHLSCLDYIGDVDWRLSRTAKDWYARIKSRPGFRTLLSDRVPGITPPEHYVDLDF